MSDADPAPEGAPAPVSVGAAAPVTVDEDSTPTSGQACSGRAHLAELFGIDVRSLALFRVAIAALILVDLVIRLQDFTAHYTDAGWLPVADLARYPDPLWPFAPHLLSGDPRWQALLFGLHFLVATCLLVGWRTRVSAFLTWMLLLSLQARNPGTLDGADMLMRMELFWGLFLPLGAYASLDARKDPRLRDPPRRLFNLATVALVMQPFMLYEFAAMAKVAPEWIEHGSGVYFALHLDQLALPLGIWLRQFEGLLWWINWATLAIEYVAPVTLFWPWRFATVRMASILVLTGMQVGFGTTIRLMHFPFISTISILPLLPSEFWDGLARWAPRLGLQGRREPLPAGHPLRTWPLTAAVAGGLSAYCFVWNIGMLPDSPVGIPAALRPLGMALRIDQTWYLFTPPWTSDGWFVPVGVTRDGRVLDLRTGREASHEKPAGGTYEMFDTHRTWAYLRFLRTRGGRPFRRRYLEVLAAAWDEDFVAVRLDYVLEGTYPPPGGRTTPPVVGVLWQGALGTAGLEVTAP